MLGLTRTAMARELGITPQGLIHYERGSRRLDIGVAIQIVGRTGLTLDWLYRGDTRGLDPRLAWALP